MKNKKMILNTVLIALFIASLVVVFVADSIMTGYIILTVAFLISMLKPAVYNMMEEM